MSDEKKPFTVTDRRHFTPEGQSRPEDAEPSPVAAPAAARPPAADPADEAIPGLDESDEAYDDDGMPPPPIPADFPGLVVSLAAQATLLLGMAPGAPKPDLDGARGVISLLEMLQEKTKGNRTPDEDRLLEDVLYQLRMAYVMRTKAGA
jgi:hypothetical protein